MNEKKIIKTISFEMEKVEKKIEFDVSFKRDRFEGSQKIFLSKFICDGVLAPTEILKDGDFIHYSERFVLRARGGLFKFLKDFFVAKDKRTNEFLFALDEELENRYKKEFSREFIRETREQLQKEYDAQFKDFLEDKSNKVVIRKSSGYDYSISIDNVNRDNLFIKEYNEILNKATGDSLRKYLESTYKKDDDYGDYAIHTYYYLDVATLEDVKSKCLEILEDREKAKIKKKEEYESRIKELALKAKEEGKMQILNSYSCPCNDPREECNVDIITDYVNEDGKIITKRSHTW